MPTLRRAWWEKVVTNTASVKVWIFVACVGLCAWGYISGDNFQYIVIALIGAREVWKVAKLRNGK